MSPVGGSCANCAEPLTGEYCSRCGQRAVDYHRPFFALLSDLVGDVFNLDTRLVHTLRPLFLKPGQVAKDYIAGRRAAHVPPLKSYLIAALIFFGLFTVFPWDAPVDVFVRGTPAEAASRNRTGGRQSFSMPPSIPYRNDWYQAALARAMREPERFAQTVGTQFPRAFFLLLPLFALFLKLLYRRQGYLVDHLVFSLYYHAFVFLVFSLLFLTGRADWFLPGGVRFAIVLALLGWLLAYLPIALRRVYGGGRSMTALKLVVLGVLYVYTFASTIPLILGAALLQM
jgi:hypothetical protein